MGTSPTVILKSLRGHTCWSLVRHKAIGEHFAATLPGEVVQWHCDDTGVCVCQLSRDWPLSLSTDWRWDLEEKLLLLCLLYGSFFTLNAENLFRGQRIPASPWRPQLILAAPGIDKAFSGAKYAAYVLHLSSLYFPVAQSIGTCSARVCWALGNVSRSSAHAHAREQGMISVPLSVSGAANTSRDKRWHCQNES